MDVSLKKRVFKSSITQAAILSGLLTGALAASDDPVYDRLIGNETESITTEQSLIPDRQPQSLGTPRQSDEVIRRIERDRLGELRDYGQTEEQDPADAFFDSIEWGVVVEGELVSNMNKADSYRRETDAVYTADFGFLMHLGEKGTFYGLLEAGYGGALDGRIPTLAVFNDEVETDSNLKFTELWYEHAFGCNESWRFRIGHLDLTTDFDTNNYANSGISQFNSTGFVHNLTLGYEYACPSFGVMLWKDFGEAISVGAAYLAEDGFIDYDEDGFPDKTDSWTDIFHHGFGILETDFHLDAGGHEGNLRFYGWVSRSEMYAYTAEGKKGTSAGFGTNFDQELSHYLGVWGRFGYGDAEYNFVTKHYSGGVQFQHFNACWHRDVIGVGYGIAEPGDTLSDLLEDPGKEHFVEAYYRHVFNDFAHLSPFAQFVKNPLGDKESDSAFVLGLRGAFEI